MDVYCNNCGKLGHMFSYCKIPITSFGIILFRLNDAGIREYLMIRRKDTLGFIDFMRGKYNIYNKCYILNMLKQMTNSEKELLTTKSFTELWNTLWGEAGLSSYYKSEENLAREKFNSLKNGVFVNRPSPQPQHYLEINTNNINNVENKEYQKPAQPLPDYTLESLIATSNEFEIWETAEWGFPKGRRNYQEREFDCAVREMLEETGYSMDNCTIIKNILPFEENFTGSNYKSYKHKYFIMFMNLTNAKPSGDFSKTEVSRVEWKTYDDVIKCIRPYNLEKLGIIKNVELMLSTNDIFFV